MNEQVQNVVAALDGGQVIFKAQDVDVLSHAAQHVGDRREQAVEIELDVVLERFVGFGGGPVRIADAGFHGVDDGARVVDVADLFEVIAVIPASHFAKIQLSRLAERFDFFFCEADEFAELQRLCHGEF